MQTVDVFFNLAEFECHAQVESEAITEANASLLARIKWLKNNGAQPRLAKSYPQRPRQKPQDGQQVGSDTNEERCPIHRKAKAGQYGVYCPTKLEDGSWCKWKPSNGKVTSIA